MGKSILLLSLLLTGCAMNYKPPTALSPMATQRFNHSKSEMFAAARRALVVDGYQIISADLTSGTISTASRDQRVKPDIADCGTTMGIDYLLDNRTTTQVGMGVIVYDSEINVRASIRGEYKPGSVSQDITLTCVSKGRLERDMLQKIIAEANRL